MATDAGLDLVEIQAESRPPLCKIMDYGKYKYELSKKERAQNAAKKSNELKEVRLGRSAKIDDHDVEIRVNQARRFIIDGHKVMFVQKFRGREMAHQRIGYERLQEIVEALADVSKVEVPPKMNGRQVSMILTPDRPKVEAIRRKMDAEKAQLKAEKGEDAHEEPQALDDLEDHNIDSAEGEEAVRSGD
jgi:translation initiation factor IF-3